MAIAAAAIQSLDLRPGALAGLIQSLIMTRLWLSLRHRQQCLDVINHRLQSGSDRLEAGQAQQS